jgi:hypothetical protein
VDPYLHSPITLHGVLVKLSTSYFFEAWNLVNQDNFALPLHLGSNRPPIQWVPGALSLGLKWLGREADHISPTSAEVKE